MDENNTNMENSTADSTAKSPLSYDAPKENDFANDTKKEASESTSNSTVSEAAPAETTSAIPASEPAKTESTPSAFSVSESRSGSSNTEVFGGQVEGTPTPSSNTYSTNTYSTNNYSSDSEEFSKGFGIASLVMGILSILTCCCSPLSILFAILGIIFSCVQKKDMDGNRPSQATAGLILSIIGIVIVGVGIVFSLVASGTSWYKELMNSTL